MSSPMDGAPKPLREAIEAQFSSKNEDMVKSIINTYLRLVNVTRYAYQHQVSDSHLFQSSSSLNPMKYVCHPKWQIPFSIFTQEVGKAGWLVMSEVIDEGIVVTVLNAETGPIATMSHCDHKFMIPRATI